MAKLFTWLFVGVIIFGIIAYANPQLWEDVKGKVTELKDIKLPSLESCPQINVSISDSDNIKGKNYDGWAIKGDATCRKGNKEGENLNKYYCGGYISGFMGIGDVNAYVEKTPISDEGDIGKTYKYVIWNIYDENGDFVETKCLGNPDDYYKKQEEDFARQIMALP